VGREGVRHLHHVFDVDAHGLVTNDNVARRRAAQDLRGLEHDYQSGVLRLSKSARPTCPSSVGAGNNVTSYDLRILMNESADPIMPEHAGVVIWGGWIGGDDGGVGQCALACRPSAAAAPRLDGMWVASQRSAASVSGATALSCGLYSLGTVAGETDAAGVPGRV